jgi:succinate-semialdehyde dehydrogenase / glutarate-semialdehyde dehydrogenase
MFTSVNPATLEMVATYPAHTKSEQSQIIEMTSDTQGSWSKTSFQHRAGLMNEVARVLHQNKQEYARLITLEMGKPIRQSEAEIEKCASACIYYAENAEKFLASERIETNASESYVAYRPLGVLLAIMPWNFPFWQVFRFAAPALMAGNGALLKHASNVMGCAMAIEKVFREAGLPEDLFRSLKIGSDAVAGIIENKKVKAVTLTGSVGAGKAVAAKAGEALKKTVLELGGSDPYIILGDADLDHAANVCAASRLVNGGQSCIAAKRFIVVENVYDLFLEKFVSEMEKKKMGDPFDEQTNLGPQAQMGLRDELHLQVTTSIVKGARCLIGGTIPDMKGAWYPPTILDRVKPGMPAYDQEIFGPVAAVIRAKDDIDAVRIANDSEFGLGAAVFTGNLIRGKYIAENFLEAGSCFVNEMVQSDPRLPFGGIGHSGYGRELSWFGIREFTNIKTVYMG